MDEKIEVILIDVGNTLIKSVEVIEGNFQNWKTWEGLDELNAFYPISIPAMITSVGTFEDQIFSERKHTVLTSTTDLPISLDYKTPETLGADRIAAAVGAWTLFPNENSLVIDVGTCITIDLINSEGVFKGGAISPGLRMRMKAMANYTSQLPDISMIWEEIDLNMVGKSSKECLLSGSFFGIVHELNGAVETFTQDFTSINVILTGGDAHFFESKLKATIFACSKIVQTGLYSIWKKAADGNN